MLDPLVKNEYVLEAFAQSIGLPNGTRSGIIFGPRGAAQYIFGIVDGVYVLKSTDLL